MTDITSFTQWGIAGLTLAVLLITIKMFIKVIADNINNNTTSMKELAVTISSLKTFLKEQSNKKNG